MVSDFELVLRGITPPTYTENIEEVAIKFLKCIGYLPARIDPKSGASSVRESIAYRVFMECFMMHPDRMWSVDEIAAYLGTTKASVYRYINRLKRLDLLEEANVREGKNRAKKTYRIRYGNLRKAWNFVEANAHLVLENYREIASHLQKIVDKVRGGVNEREG